MQLTLVKIKTEDDLQDYKRGGGIQRVIVGETDNRPLNRICSQKLDLLTRQKPLEKSAIKIVLFVRTIGDWWTASQNYCTF